MIVTFDNGAQRVSFEARNVRRGMSTICADPRYNFCEPASFDGRDENGVISAEWRGGADGSYKIYSHDGYEVVGEGFLRVLADA